MEISSEIKIKYLLHALIQFESSDLKSQSYPDQILHSYSLETCERIMEKLNSRNINL